MKNKRTLKITEDFYNFLFKFGANRVKVETDTKQKELCYLPDIIVRYFKANNDRYMELIKMEYENGTK